MDLQGLFHSSLHIILLWGLKDTSQITDTNNLTCPILCVRLHHGMGTPLLSSLSTAVRYTQVTTPPSHHKLSHIDLTLLKRISTGKVRPGIWKMGTFPKKEANLSASMVAEVTTSFRSERRATT